jgi:hypothetical protein
MQEFNAPKADHLRLRRMGVTAEATMQVRTCIAFWLATVGGCVACLLTTGPAFAQYEPVIVVPGKPGVPVMYFGRDISWSIVEGDFGLARPSQTNPTVIYRRAPGALIGPPSSGYYPATGQSPRYGRLEIEPPANRRLPPPAESYYRSWSTQPDSEPATIYPPYDPPPVIVAPPRKRPGQPPRAQPQP